MKYTKLYILLVGILFGFNLFAQNVEEEVEFLYMKAKYLYDTDRHEDAVNAFNKVIKKDPSHEDALVLRGASKFGLAAYKGAMNDFSRSIELRGVTKDVVGWIALTHYKMDNTQQALNTLETALSIDSKNRTLWTLQGDLAIDEGEKLKACESWERAAELGDTKAERKLAAACGGMVTKKPKGNKGRANQGATNPTNASEEEVEITSDDNSLDEDEVISLGEKYEDEKNDKEENEEEIVEDENNDDEENIGDDEVLSLGDKEEEEEESSKPVKDPNEKTIIEVDEDLTLEIYGEGLGYRKILDQPNILILAEEDGVVAINICVGRTGSVKSAEFNDDLSTINRQSLISLAIRKSKEFWFAKDRNKEACGVILYKIKGS